MEIDIDNNSITQCPLVKFEFVRVLKCIGCDNYKGLAPFVEEPKTMKDCHIICQAPYTRKVVMLDGDV